MKSFVAALAVVVATAVASAASADLAGTWNVEGEVASTAFTFVCKLAQDGEKLSGTATLEGREMPVTGSIQDRAVTLAFDVDYNGQIYSNLYKGTLGDNGILEGTIEVAGQLGSFKAKKQ